MGFLGKIFGPVMSLCYSMFKNYGIAIIVFTILTKLLLFPLSYWLQINSIKIVKMYPELNRIKARFFGDKNAIAEEESKLYKKEKYNPLASIFPLIIQIILLMAVVEVIYKPMTYILKQPQEIINSFVEVAVSNNDLNIESNSIQLSVIEDIQNGNTQNYLALENAYPNIDINEEITKIQNLNMNFLGFNLGWIASIKKGKVLLVPLLAALSSIVLAYGQNKMNPLQQEQSLFNKYGMLVFSACLSLYLGTFVPTGVGLYWIASNLLAILIQYILNIVYDPKKYIDYEELEASKKELKELSDNSSKPKKALDFFSVDSKRVRADYKRFFSIENKHLVFYSESNGFYKYFKGYIEYILEYTNIPIHYVTSDPNDNIFEMAKNNPQIQAYFIDSTTLITLMMKIDADVIVMTMPDLETYQIKRSYVRKNIEYINVMHGIGSVNLTYRTGALDHYDTIFVANDSQKEEIRKTEIAYSLPKKNIVDVGYPLLDDMMNTYAKMEKKSNDIKTILIAPSWQKDNIVDSVLEDILDNLKGHGFNVIVRPHPQHVRHMPEKMEALKQKYQDNKDIQIQTDFSSNLPIFEADLLITDWSDISFEYALTTHRPVLFINTPMKIMNPEYQRIDTIPLNIKVRDIIGLQLETNQTNQIVEKINYLIDHHKNYENNIQDLIDNELYNVGNSREVGARYIIDAVFKHIEKKENNS